MTPGLPPHDHAARRGRLRAQLREPGIAALLVTAPPNVRYLTGFTGSNGQFVIGADGAEVLITDARYRGRAAVECPDLDPVLDRDWIGAVVGLAADLDLDRVGFEEQAVSYGCGVELQARLGEEQRGAIACSGSVENLRLVKDEAELARLERACAITDETWTALLDHVRPGQTELELARFLRDVMADLGADGPSFPSIVASGPNSAIPHHEPGRRPLARDELLKVDFGAKVDGYHADMTRTIASGDPPDELVTIHELVREAQEQGVQAATAGTSARTVDRVCRDHLTAAGHGERFLHGTGHGVGLEIHEAPAVSRESSASLEPHAVITVEPGVYVDGLGGVRIEDTVVVTSSGPARRLTNSPRDLIRL